MERLRTSHLFPAAMSHWAAVQQSPTIFASVKDTCSIREIDFTTAHCASVMRDGWSRRRRRERESRRERCSTIRYIITINISNILSVYLLDSHLFYPLPLWKGFSILKWCLYNKCLLGIVCLDDIIYCSFNISRLHLLYLHKPASVWCNGVNNWDKWDM